MNAKRFVRLVLLNCFVLVSGFSRQTQIMLINGNNDLVPSNSFTLRGDVISAGVGLRGTGSGIS